MDTHIVVVNDFDFIEWAGEYEILEKIKTQLETLKDVVVCS